MNEFLQNVEQIAMGTSVWVYLFIFFGKILEVSCGTLRIVLINRGVRTVGSLIAFVEISLWLLVASSVLVGFREDFWKGVVYALAFALGNYIGSWLDELLAFGLSSVQIIISDPQESARIEEQLRAKAFGVTSMDVHGRDADHIMLIVTMKRKRVNEAVDWLQKNCVGAVITVSDIMAQRGGFLCRDGRSGPMRIGQ